MSERQTTHWYCECGEALNSRSARDHICPEATCPNCGEKGVGVHTCKGPNPDDIGVAQGMTFCQDHWDRLRIRIEVAGLGHMVSESGEEAARRMQLSVEQGEDTRENFDPLMSAHMAIIGNALQLIGMFQGCPLCVLNKMHEEHCEDPECSLPKVNAFDFWMDKATEDMVNIVEGFDGD